MAKKTTCDICDAPAQAEAEFKTTTTTLLKWDLCEPHLAELKKIIRVFSKQEIGELEVTEEEVIVKPNKS